MRTDVTSCLDYEPCVKKSRQNKRRGENGADSVTMTGARTIRKTQVTRTGKKTMRRPTGCGMTRRKKRTRMIETGTTRFESLQKIRLNSPMMYVSGCLGSLLTLAQNEIITLPYVDRARITRTCCSKHMFNPLFEQAARGAFTLVKIGEDRQTQESVYRLCVVKGMAEEKCYRVKEYFSRRTIEPTLSGGRRVDKFATALSAWRKREDFSHGRCQQPGDRPENV